MVSISISYIDKIINNPLILNDYNERTFVRLLSGIELAKKNIELKNSGRSFTLSSLTKLGFEK